MANCLEIRYWTLVSEYPVYDERSKQRKQPT